MHSGQSFAQSTMGILPDQRVCLEALVPSRFDSDNLLHYIHVILALPFGVRHSCQRALASLVSSCNIARLYTFLHIAYTLTKLINLYEKYNILYYCIYISSKSSTVLTIDSSSFFSSTASITCPRIVHFKRLLQKVSKWHSIVRPSCR